MELLEICLYLTITKFKCWLIDSLTSSRTFRGYVNEAQAFQKHHLIKQYLPLTHRSVLHSAKLEVQNYTFDESHHEASEA
jgi:hypothetical protein